MQFNQTFDHVLATVETIEIIETTAGQMKNLGFWEVTDKFDAKAFRINVFFEEVSYII